MYTEMDGMEVQTEHTPPAQPFCPHGQIYTVMAGDSLFSIAQRFGISLQELVAANPQITNPDLIFPGELICIPVVVQPFPGEPLVPTPHPMPCPEMPAPPYMPCPEMPVSPPMPCPGMPVAPPMPYPEPVMPIMPGPVPCPAQEQGPYPAPLGVPMPEPYYLGSFIYASPPVNWDECPYARRRRRRRLSLRRRRA